jgi:hypothetical protein
MNFIRSLILTSVFGSLSEIAYATPCSTVSCIHSAPAPEIGGGVVGFAVAGAIALALFVVPRIRKSLQHKPV